MDNEESLNKGSEIINSCIKDFNELLQQTINLKKKIENEMTEIDKLYDKVNNEVSNSFKKKHEKLMLEENKLKEKLQNEVTKIKEKLEYSLTESSELIKINEKLNKGFKILENEEEKNIIKNLSYTSKMNKNKNGMKKIIGELMKSLNISFDKDKTEINYEEYYFNGIQIPKNIEFKNINNNSTEVFWKIDNIKKNIDNNKIKFKIEIKKENSNEKFIQVYEGNNTNYLIKNLEKGINYEIRICSIYDNSVSSWSKIEKFKTTDIDIDIDSLILKDEEKKTEFLQKIIEWSGYKRMELLYRETRDGSTADIFHKKCDNQGPTIVLYKNEKGNIFGGYASISWTNSGAGKAASDSFIFTLTNIHGIEPTKFINSNSNWGVYHYHNQGPVFGADDIFIGNDFNQNCNSLFPECYEDILGKGKSIFTGNINNNINYLKMKEIEVYKVFK